jgi:hypothetical protein
VAVALLLAATHAMEMSLLVVVVLLLELVAIPAVLDF